jgi:hypothetical protein
VLDERREMLRGRQGPKSVDPLIGSEEIGEIVARRDWFNPESQKMVLAVGCSLYLAQHMF